eukprot:scaffold39313_cov46-Prasinocladus_malaysianus.AAC.1
MTKTRQQSRDNTYSDDTGCGNTLGNARQHRRLVYSATDTSQAVHPSSLSNEDCPAGRRNYRYVSERKQPIAVPAISQSRCCRCTREETRPDDVSRVRGESKGCEAPHAVVVQDSGIVFALVVSNSTKRYRRPLWQEKLSKNSATSREPQDGRHSPVPKRQRMLTVQRLPRPQRQMFVASDIEASQVALMTPQTPEALDI